jgi:hypothetical protein
VSEKPAIVCQGGLDVLVFESERGIRLRSYRKRKEGRATSDTLDFTPASATFQDRYFATIDQLIEALKPEIEQI